MTVSGLHNFASDLRRHGRNAARIGRRMSLTVIVGRVLADSQDLVRRTVRLVIGTSASGEDVLSPPVRWGQWSVGDLGVHWVPANGEQMVVISQSGTIGEGSVAYSMAYDAETPPPSTDSDQVVIRFHDTEMVLTPKFVTGRIGKSRFVAHDQGAKIRDGVHWVSVQEETGVWMSAPPQLYHDPVPE